jgi:tryptophan synthase beta chain
MHANLFTSGRGRFMSATDEEAMKWAFEISRLEGIIPALETAHAFAVLEELELSSQDTTVICLSGRGDKDLATYMTAIENQ